MLGRASFKRVIVGGVIASFLLQGSTALAAGKINPKPGSVVKATTKEKLVIGKFGFTDESSCSTRYTGSECAYEYNPPNYVTTWAFSVKNGSPTISASKLRAKIVFKDAGGNVLLDIIVPVAREIKPGKIAWVAANTDRTTSSITGVASATAEIVSNTWIVPTRSIYQNSIELTATSKGFATDGFNGLLCVLSTPCSKDESVVGRLTNWELSGPFTWRGVPGKADRQIIYLNANGEPIGGWSSSQIEYKTGSQATSNYVFLNPYEAANIVKFIYAVSN